MFDEAEEFEVQQPTPQQPQPTEGDVNALVKKMEAAYSKAKDMERTFSKMRADHENYDHRLKCIWGIVSGCEGRLEKQIKKRGDQYAQTIQRYADNYDRIENTVIHAHKSTMETRIDLEKRVFGFGKTLKTLAAEKANATAVAEHKQFVRNKMSTIETRAHTANKARVVEIQKVQGQVNNLANFIKDMLPTNDRLNEVVQGFEVQLADIKQRLDASRLEAPKAVPAAVDDARVTSLSEAISLHDQWFGEVAERITDHESRIQECEKKEPSDFVVPDVLAQRIESIASRIENVASRVTEGNSWELRVEMQQQGEEKLEKLRADMLQQQEESFGALRADMQRQHEEEREELRQQAAQHKNASEERVRDLETKMAQFYDDFVSSEQIFASQYEVLSREHESLKADHDHLKSDCNQMKADYDQLKADCTQLKADHDQLKMDCSHLKTGSDHPKSDFSQHNADCDQLKADCNEIKADNDQIKAACNQLQADNVQLKAAYDQLKSENDRLKISHDQVKNDYLQLKEDHVELKEDHLEVAGNQFQLKVELRTYVEKEPERLDGFGDKLYKEFMDKVDDSEDDLFKEIMGKVDEKLVKSGDEVYDQVLDKVDSLYGPPLNAPVPMVQPLTAPA